MQTKQLYENNEPFYPATQADIIVAGGGVSTAARHILRYISPGVFKLDGQDYVFTAPNADSEGRVQEILELIATTLPIIVENTRSTIKIVDSLKEYGTGNGSLRFIVDIYTSTSDINNHRVSVNTNYDNDIAGLHSTIDMYVSVDPNPV